MNTPVLQVKFAVDMWEAAIGLLLIYEMIALNFGWPTLSRAVWTVDRSQYGPLIPFLAGLLAGHFFWSGQ